MNGNGKNWMVEVAKLGGVTVLGLVAIYYMANGISNGLAEVKGELQGHDSNVRADSRELIKAMQDLTKEIRELRLELNKGQRIPASLSEL